ncbi:MAG: hypothetical protein KIT73_17190, partial [Burkholderiales bacterium]|nr:hypothetical protein [Burkholderiales bacterium]
MTRRSTLLAILVALIIAVTIAVAVVLPRGPLPIDITEYKMPVDTDMPTAIAAAADGSIWFTIDFSDVVGRIRDGKIERLPKGSRNTEPLGLGVGPDGSAWMTDAPEASIVQMSPDGSTRRYELGTPIAR